MSRAQQLRNGRFAVWRQPEFWTTLGAVVVLTVGHYTTPMHDPFWHDLFRRLYYLPIILAGFRYGLWGGLVTAIAISAVFLPHVIMAREMLPKQASEAVFEIPLYLLIGALMGILSDRQRRMNASLARAERLRTLGEMAAGMAHEVKNPLAAIRSSAQILAGRVTGPESEFTGIVIAEVDRLNRVVSDFLDYARPTPLARRPVSLPELLDSCADFLAPVAAEKQAVIMRDYQDGLALVPADSDKLRQVLLNLILNAVQAVEPGGRVTLVVEPAGRQMLVRVRDNGPGIPAEKLKRVFEPFFTTRPGGTGLGLAIARGIVVEHGGRIDIASAPGDGTTVTVALPMR